MKKLGQFLWRYKIWVIIVLLIISGISYSVWKKSHTVTEYSFDTVTRQTVTDTVSESGNIETKGQANIASPIDGIVDQVYVTNGDTVGAGQALFSVKTNATDAEIAAAHATLLTSQNAKTTSEQARGTLEAAVQTSNKSVLDAQVNYNNVKRWFIVHADNVQTGRKYTKTEVDSALAALNAAQDNQTVAQAQLGNASNNIASAQASVDSAQLAFDSKNSLTIKAKSGGIVSNISINPGDKVSPSTSPTVSPAMIISQKNNNQLIFVTRINENDIAKIQIDQKGKISIDAVKNTIFDATIQNIDSIGTNTSGVITYNVYFLLDQSNSGLRAGMSGNVDTIVTTHENALTVANAAIVPYQGGKAVQILDTTQAKIKNQYPLKYIPVTTGIKTADRTEILSGAPVDMQVVTTSTANQFKSSIFGG